MCLAAPSPTNTTRASGRAANMIEAACTSKPGDFSGESRAKKPTISHDAAQPLAPSRSQFTGQLAFAREHSTGHAALSTLP